MSKSHRRQFLQTTGALAGAVLDGAGDCDESS